MDKNRIKYVPQTYFTPLAIENGWGGDEVADHTQFLIFK